MPKYWPAVLGLVEIHLQHSGVYCWQAAGALVLAGNDYSRQGLVVGHRVLLGKGEMAVVWEVCYLGPWLEAA